MSRSASNERNTNKAEEQSSGSCACPDDQPGVMCKRAAAQHATLHHFTSSVQRAIQLTAQTANFWEQAAPYYGVSRLEVVLHSLSTAAAAAAYKG
jgi:hypothetical protein